jgi:protein-S-isoprenylcysteine O-methyltransferase Ste14
MFLGVAAAQVGFFLALPSVFSAICLIVGLSVLQRQVLAEEAHLSGRFSEDYKDYSTRVRRWF